MMSCVCPVHAADFRILTGHGGPVMSARISDAGDDCALTGSFDNSVGLWSLNEATNVRWLEGHEAAVKSVLFISETSNCGLFRAMTSTSFSGI